MFAKVQPEAQGFLSTVRAAYAVMPSGYTNSRAPGKPWVTMEGPGITGEWLTLAARAEEWIAVFAKTAIEEAAEEQLPIVYHSWTIGGGQAAQVVGCWSHEDHIHHAQGEVTALGHTWLVKATNETDKDLVITLVE